MTITLETIAQQIAELSAKVDAISSGAAAAKPAATIAGDTLPGEIIVPVPAPASHVRYRVALDAQNGKAVDVIVGETGEQGFTWTYNEADPSGRSAQIGLSMRNAQGAIALDFGMASTPGTSSFAARNSSAPAWQPRLNPGRYTLAISANTVALIDFEFH